MAWYRNVYACECGERWLDEWCCGCDSECPECEVDVSPSRSLRLDPDVQGSCGDPACTDCARKDSDPVADDPASVLSEMTAGLADILRRYDVAGESVYIPDDDQWVRAIIIKARAALAAVGAV